MDLIINKYGLIYGRINDSSLCLRFTFYFLSTFLAAFSE